MKDRRDHRHQPIDRARAGRPGPRRPRSSRARPATRSRSSARPAAAALLDAGALVRSQMMLEGGALSEDAANDAARKDRARCSRKIDARPRAASTVEGEIADARDRAPRPTRSCRRPRRSRDDSAHRRPFDRAAAAHLFRRAAFAPAPGRRRPRRRGRGSTRPSTSCSRAEGRRSDGDRGARSARPDDRAAIAGAVLHRLATSASPLRENLALFFHNHFVSAFSKVRDAGHDARPARALPRARPRQLRRRSPRR